MQLPSHSNYTNRSVMFNGIKSDSIYLFACLSIIIMHLESISIRYSQGRARFPHVKWQNQLFVDRLLFLFCQVVYIILSNN